jgi:hypothetical protein
MRKWRAIVAAAGLSLVAGCLGEYSYATYPDDYAYAYPYYGPDYGYGYYYPYNYYPSYGFRFHGEHEHHAAGEIHDHQLGTAPRSYARMAPPAPHMAAPAPHMTAPAPMAAPAPHMAAPAPHGGGGYHH